MTPPTRLLHTTGEPWIDHHQFILFDVESHHTTSELPPRAHDAIAASGPGGALFFTLGDMTDITVDFELWTTEPDAPKHAYEQRYDGTFTVQTGRLVLGAITGSPADVIIDLPVEGPFNLRAFRNSHNTPSPDFPDIDHHDEQWLIQAWPTG